MQLTNSHVVITGASRGIGSAAAHALKKRGARLSLVARSSGPLNELAAELGAEAFVVDLSRPDSLASVIEKIEAKSGPIDALINNAAGSYSGPFTEMTGDGLQQLVHANLLAPMELCRLVTKGMVARGHGNILNVSSVGGEFAIRHQAAYGGTKAGLALFSSVLQRELRRKSVHVSLLILGEIQTDMVAEGRKDPLTAAACDRFGIMGSLTAKQVADGMVEMLLNDTPCKVMPRLVAPMIYLRRFPSRLLDLAMAGL